MIVKGKYRKSKIYLYESVDIKDNTEIKLNIIHGFELAKYFGIMKDAYQGSSVSFINDLRKQRTVRLSNAANWFGHPNSNEIIESAYEIYKTSFLTNNMSANDALIAATSIYYKFPLVSRNKKHYTTIEKLELTVPY